MNLFRSKIGREIFVLSSMTAILPLLAVGWIAMSRLNDSHMGRTADYLEESARNFGRQYYDRLLSAIETAALHHEAGSATTDSETIVSLRSFPVAAGGSELATTGIDELDEILASATRPTVFFDHGDAEGRAYVVVPLETETLIAELAASYLWGDPAEYPYAVDFCAFAKGSPEPLYCSAPVAVEMARSVQLNRDLAATFIWDGTDSEMISSYWEMFTRSAVDGPLVRFVASQSADVAIAPWQSSRTVYISGLATTLVLVLLAATAYVRRLLRPIDKLLQATRNFASGDFSHIARVRRHDEFRDLADSMNSMAASIDSQFRTLELLSDIDRLVLDGSEIDDVVRLILRQAMRMDCVQCATVLLLDSQARNAAIAHRLSRGDELYSLERVKLNAPDFPVLWQRGDDPAEVGSNELQEGFGIRGPADGTALVWPIRAAGHPVAALILEFEASSSPELEAEGVKRIGEFARRLSVALELFRREAKLVESATIDALTGLPNRYLLLDRLNQELVRVRRNCAQLALAFIDLDRFKQVNDTYGHARGDGVLKEAAARLSQCVRETDTVARLGGDEFVILMPVDVQSGDVSRRLDAVLVALAEPFYVDMQEFFLSASIGVARYPKDGTTAEELLRKADTAMYGAKNDGRGKSVDFSESMEIHITKRMQLESELRKAIDGKEMQLVYQPQYSLQSNRPVSLEALLRWKHPTKGLISPLDFIPAAEDSGYINVLGAWVLSEACNRIGAWQDAGVPLARVAVNVSVKQFELADFVHQVRDRLEFASVSPQNIELEITESVFLSGIDRVRKKLDELRSIGIAVAIDDFGTGFSSLSYIRDLPFDVIKIDRAFITDLPYDRDACAIVKAITVMAQTLGKQIVAEGVETEAQRDFLCEQGVDLAQGYLFGRPMEADRVADLFTVSYGTEGNLSVASKTGT